MDLVHYPFQIPELSEVQEWLRGCSYKNWELSAYHDPHEGICLYIVVEVMDAFSDKNIQLRIRSVIPPPCLNSQNVFLEYLLWRLMQIEIHETREFFKCNGVVYRNPHDPYEPKKVFLNEV